MVKFFIRLIALFGLLVSHSSNAFMKVTATVDKNPVVVNESFVLTVTADDDVNTNALDTSALMQDFIVGRTSVSSQTNMINFKTTRTTTWTTVLIARKAGTITIPALPVDTLQTQPIQLTVLAVNDPSAAKQQDLFITTDISAKEVYVQQQVTLTVKLHFSAELKRGSLTEPSLEGANILQIGKDNESDTIINGRRYRIIERTYAISPQQSGDYILKPPVFSGEILVPSTRRNSFLSFGETKPVSVVGDEIPLTIKPIPAHYQGVWLPSELLSLHQEWQPTTDKFVVGEPITRILTLTAVGLSEEQLPEIILPMPDGLKIYPDQAELHTGMNSGQLVSQKVRNFAIVANKAGTYQLPEIKLPWWNTITNKLQYATIEAQTITVLPNPEYKEAPIAGLNQTNQSGQTPNNNTQTVYVQQTPWLQWLFLALWLLTSFAWLCTHLIINKKSVKKSHEPKVTDHYLALLAACKKNDGEKALNLLLPWLNSISDHQISTLAEAVKYYPQADFISAFKDLQQSFFGKEQSNWQGKNLLSAILNINKTPKSKPNSTHVDLSLNPQ